MSSGGGAGGGASKKLGGLKATKVAQNFDFEKAQKEAESEEERIRQLGYDRKREEDEAEAEKKRKEAEKVKAASLEIGGPAKSGLGGSTAPVRSNSTASPAPAGSSQDMARLGMGMKRLGFGSTGGPATSPSASSTPSRSSSVANDDGTTVARDRFSAQKAISSDQYFNRGHYDPDASAEAQRRLQDFRGASGISSSAYFGREEEENEMGGGAASGDGSLAQLEYAAKEAVARVMSNPDVQRAGETMLQKARQVRADGFYYRTVADNSPP